MSYPINPIGPRERDIEPVLRVERRRDEDASDERARKERRDRDEQSPAEPDAAAAEPHEGDDGAPHIDVRV